MSNESDRVDLAEMKRLAALPGDLGFEALEYWMATNAQVIISEIECLRRELDEARKALAYAISEADGWFDDSRGGRIEAPEMDAARLIAAKQSQG